MSMNSERKYVFMIFAAAFVLMLLSGAATFAAGIMGWQTHRIWQAYLVNFVFWTGLAYGGMFFVALCNLTNARFSRPMKRLAESLGAFLPISLLMLIGLYFGREDIFPWLHVPIAHKQAWLNVRFLFWREGAGLLVLTITAFILMVASLKSDRSIARYVEKNRLSSPDEILQTARQNGSWRVQVIFSPLFCVLYVFILTMTSWDFIMMLSTEWYSTLFGAYYFMGAFYSAIAAIFIISLLVSRKSPLRNYIDNGNYHSLGKFMLAFMLVTADFFFSQYLVMWYGNLPVETRFLIDRFHDAPWRSLSWSIMFLIFVIPFIVLLSRRSKSSAVIMFSLSSLILIGMWLERFLLVVPSLWQAEKVPLGIEEALISLGFFGLMGLCVLFYLRIGPWVPVGDPIFIQHYQPDFKASA